MLRGIEGFGAGSRLHTHRILHLAEDLPIIIEVVDRADRIDDMLPKLDSLVEEGMVTVRSILEIRNAAPQIVITDRHLRPLRQDRSSLVRDETQCGLTGRLGKGAQMADLETTDLEAPCSALQGEVVAPGDAEYQEVRTIWNAMIDRNPAAVVCPAEATDAAKAIKIARERDLPLAVRGGGHNVAGNATCDDGADRVRDAYPPAVWSRLVEAKRRYDPDNAFRLNQNIPPD